MDPQEFVDAVREDEKTALSRLGSSKALYADTGGDLADDAVLAAAADRAHHAAETLEAWAADESDAAAALFAETAETERDHVETVADERGEYDPGDAPAVQVHLREVDGTAERLGAFVGWALAAGANADQVVGYFVGQASPRTASTFRDVSGDYDDYLDDAGAVLETVCGDDAADADGGGDGEDGEEGEDSEDGWTRAREAAAAAVRADYDEYYETLESLGVNPKPVC